MPPASAFACASTRAAVAAIAGGTAGAGGALAAFTFVPFNSLSDLPVKMIVYKGFGHGINKPKQQRAVMEHNYDWFSKYIWGEG